MTTMKKTICVRVRRFGWALSLTLGLDPRRFGWRHLHRDSGNGVSGAWAFRFGMLTYLQQHPARR